MTTSAVDNWTVKGSRLVENNEAIMVILKPSFYKERMENEKKRGRRG